MIHHFWTKEALDAFRKEFSVVFDDVYRPIVDYSFSYQHEMRFEEPLIYHVDVDVDNAFIEHINFIDGFSDFDAEIYERSAAVLAREIDNDVFEMLLALALLDQSPESNVVSDYPEMPESLTSLTTNNFVKS